MGYKACRAKWLKYLGYSGYVKDQRDDAKAKAKRKAKKKARRNNR